MGDFFAPISGQPSLPPEPDTPLPNFTTVGQNIGSGLAKSGALSSIWDGLLNVVAQIATWLLAWILKAVVQVTAWFIGVLTNAENDAAASYGQLVANTLQNVFGVTVSPSQVNTRGPAGQRQQVANQLAQAVLGVLFSGTSPQPGGGIAPSDAAANGFLATTMNMAVNGWLESWVTDALSYHELQKFGDLKDVVARVLGLGRMSRQVFAPPIKVLVHDPYLALLNQKYRPKGLAEGTYIKLYFQNKLTRNQLSTVLGNEGYSEQYIDYLIAEEVKKLSLQDVDYLVSHGTWSTGQGLAYISSLGYDSDGANQVYALEVDKRIEKYRREMCTVAEAAFVKGDLGLTELQSVVQSAGIAHDEQQWFVQVAQLKRSLKITHLSLGEIESGILDGILTFNDLRNWATREGMPLTEEQELELETAFKQNKQTAAAAAKAAAAKVKAAAAVAKQQAAVQKAAQVKAQAPDRGVTVAQAETLVKDGLWTFDHLSAYLTARGYGPSAVDAIVALLHADMGKTAGNTAAATGVRATAAAKGLSLAEMEKAVVAGHRSIADLQAYLSAHGFDAADVQVIVELVEDQIHANQVKAAAKGTATTTAGAHGISLPELERAVMLGLTPIATYTAALAKAGFDELATTLLTAIAQAALDKANATAAKKGTVPAKGGTPALKLGQLEAEIVAGIKPITDYTAALAQIGYSVSDQQDLTELLQAKVDNAKAVAAQKNSAGKTLTNRGISLHQAETAVKLGIIPIDAYKSMLTAAGFTADAVDVLSASLLAEVAKLKKAVVSVTTPAVPVAIKGLTFGELEHAVVAGVKPIADYSAALRAAGYSAADTSTLTELLRLKIEHAAAAETAHADAEGKATKRGISLGDAEKAVMAGDSTMEDYDALLSALGYDKVDRTILEDLLLSRIEAAAAKAGDGGTGGA